MKEKRDKLSKSKRNSVKLQDYLTSTFCFTKNKEDSQSPARKRKRTSCDVTVVQQTLHPSHIDPVASMTYASLVQDYTTLQELHKEKNAECEALMKDLAKEKKRRLYQECVRMQKSSDLWRKKYKDLRATISVDQEVKRLRSCLTTTKHYYRKRLREVEKELSDARSHTSCLSSEKALKETIASLEDDLTQQLDILNELRAENNNIQSMAGGRYTPEVRRAVYEAIQAQCPVSRAGNLMNKILEILSGRKLTQVPSSVTVSRMAKELGTLADLQTAETILQNENCTVGWDATELSGSHINAVHVAVKPNDSVRTYHTLSIAGLPGGKTGDYAAHITVSVISSILNSQYFICLFFSGQSEGSCRYPC